MEKELIFSIISTILTIGGNLPYFIDIIKGRSFPHPITFGVWSILTGFNSYVLFLASEYEAFAPSISTFVCVVIFMIFGLIHYKRISINWFDYLCLGLSMLLIGYWIISRNVLNTVILTVIIDFIAFLPTFKKGWLQPWSETIIAYIVPGITQIFTILAITSPNIETTIFWGYILLANIVFSILVISRRYYLKGWKSIFE